MSCSLGRYKRKPRDEGKEHGGFALLRFETPEEATAAILALDGGEIKGAVRIPQIWRGFDYLDGSFDASLCA